MPQTIIPGEKILIRANEICINLCHEYVTPEHVLAAFLGTQEFTESLMLLNANISKIANDLKDYFTELDTLMPDEQEFHGESHLYTELLNRLKSKRKQEDDKQDNYLLLQTLLDLKESKASQILSEELGGERGISLLLIYYKKELEHSSPSDSQIVYDDGFDEMLENLNKEDSLSLVRCMNDEVNNHSPLIGREEELERTIEVLCRMNKNNPLHIGEPGVGKTALVWGLVRKITDGKVPSRLKSSKIYQLDISTLIANGQYRGEMEKKLQNLMSTLSQQEGSIVYIDDLHTMIGAGRSNDSSLDATDVLKPFMDGGDIRFIGTTTPSDFKQHLERNRGLLRRFQQIEIKEPDIDECIHILSQLKQRY